MAGGKNPLGAGARKAPAAEGASRQALSVVEAVRYAKGAVSGLGQLCVVGEVTGFRGPNARSGHCYFQVKDDSATMSAIAWKWTYARSGVQLRDGLKIQLIGHFDVYEGQGSLSFICDAIELVGEGLLRQQVAALAKRLQAEGLMDDARKRRIPGFCQRVCVVTSLSGSVIDDVKRTLRRRNPLVELDVVGCAVQGTHAPATIIYALEVAASYAPEAILLVRGGGSFEDLMTFNDEGLARAVAACPVPVISGIGHEPDTTICDMVADRRCSTPTAAAESVAPALDEVVQVIERRRQRMGMALEAMRVRRQSEVANLADRGTQALSARLSHERALLSQLASRRCLEDPFAFVEDRKVTLAQTEERLFAAIPRSLERERRELEGLGARMASVGPNLTRAHQERLERLQTSVEALGSTMLTRHEAQVGRMAATLDALSPLKVLGRGYAIARDAQGHVVSDAGALHEGQEVTVLVGVGSFDATVDAVHGLDEAQDVPVSGEGR